MLGKTLGHYTIRQVLGRGMGSVVYSAFDHKLAREVALKLLITTEQHDAVTKARFLQEAQAAAQLDHPNIAKVFDIHESEQGQLYLVMAKYEGQTLRQRLKQGRLSFPQLLYYAYQLAQGLHFAHSQQVIHRDIKPDNLFITYDHVLKILDFGVAHLPGSQLTQSGELLGTLVYLSPEQLSGKRATLQADLWGWAMVVAEMLSGKPPQLPMHTPTLVMFHHEAQRQLAVIVNRALETDLQARYSSAKAIMAELEPLLRAPGIRQQSWQIYPSLLPGHRAASKTALGDSLTNSAKQLVGRHTELQILDDCLERTPQRLISIIGQGGMGKTALACTWAQQQQQRQSWAGVYCLEETAWHSSADLVKAIARHIGLDNSSMSASNLWQALSAQLQQQRWLLILDSASTALPEEQMHTLLSLLQACPSLYICVTQREPWQLAQEQVLLLRGLEHSSQTASQANPAVELFAYSASLSLEGFEVQGPDYPAVLRICQSLHGWPLGIQLAATWVNSISCDSIASYVVSDLDALVANPESPLSQQGILPRQQSAKAILADSWQGLSPQERRSLARLSVLEQTFSRNLAIHLAEISFTELATLVDKALLYFGAQQQLQALHPLWRQFIAMALPEEQALARQRYTAYQRAQEIP